MKIFDPVRDPMKEKVVPPFKIQLDIDTDDAFDYAEGCSKKYTLKDY